MGAFADHAKNFGAAASSYAREHGPKAASSAGTAARTAGQAVSGAYKAAGGFRGAAEHVRKFTESNRADYQNLHGSMPGAKEYITSDAGRATARHAAGGAFHKYLEKQAKSGARKGTIGGAVKNALFSFAHQALQSHMDALKHDQRIFENVAKVHRGDPEVKHLNHNQLREVTDHAEKYGGKHAEAVKKAAQGELDRRQIRKNTEWNTGEAHKDELKAERHKNIADRQAGHKEAQHQQKLKRMAELRTESGHTQASKLAHEAQRNKLIKDREAAKTKGVQARGTSIRATNASKVKTAEKLNIIGKTASGGLKVRAKEGGAVYTVGAKKAQEIQKRQSGGASTAPKAGGTRRRRAVG